jgi:DivIVA domain-containing protein
VARRRKKKQEEPEAPGLEAQAGAADRTRMTPVDIQQKVFRLAFRGYNERDVDEFLDHITEDLAALHEENKRLREQVAEGGGGGGAAGADRQAEAIVRQAREHAARLVADAEQRAAAIGATGAAVAGGPPASFLLQERHFLQQMASLIQGHAQRLKDEARRGRTPAEPAGPPEPSAPPAGREPEPSPPSAAAGLVGGAAVGGAVAAGATEEPEPEPEPEPPPAPPPAPEPVAEPAPPPDDTTAEWSPTDQEEPPRPPAQDAGDESGDPLVTAWESAFRREPGEQSFADEPPKREDQEGEPSLRELFWGEE